MYKFFFFVLFSFSSFLVTAQTEEDSEGSSKKILAFTSDTQAPMWIETIILKSNRNRTATKKLFGDITDRKPEALFILGDVVNLGYSDRQWKPMDGYIKKLRDEGIAVHAALGNHEVMGKAKTGERKFQQRFPNHVKTGFVEILDSVAVVMLNSNFGKLSKKEDDEQIAWYKKTLAELDADSSILFIISGCHHSPYTNSKIVGASKDVQDRFVKPFIQSAKSRLFLSGHCHGFEHYKMEGKDFMVIGGGGGLHQPLKTAGSFDDLAKDYKPMFHYITVERKGKELDVKSFKLCNKFEVFEEGFVLNISQDLSADRNLASKSPKEETSTTQ